MSTISQLRQALRVENDPFVTHAVGPHLGRPIQSAFREMVRHIVLGTPLILVTGIASTGKTLLVDMTARTCAEMGLLVRRVDRGDMVCMTSDQQCDVLLVDEATSIPDSVLKTMSCGKEKNAATTTVLLGLPSFAHRLAFSNVHPMIIELTPLASSDARSYLLERAASAGLPDLFTAQALNLIVDGSHGSLRMLRSIASFAFFQAASDGASQISVGFAASALAAQAAIDDASSACVIVDDSDAQNVQTNAAPDKEDSVVEMPLGIQKATARDRLVCEAGTLLDTGISDESPVHGDPWSRRAEYSSAGSDAPRSRPVPDNSVRVIAGRVLATVGLVIIGLAAIAIPMLSDTGSYSAARPSNPTAAPTQVPGLAAPPIVSRTTASNKPASRSESVAVDESEPADGIATGATKATTNARLPLAAGEVAAPGPRPERASQPEGQHVVVVVHGVNLHATAARGSKIVDTLPKGVRVTMIEQRGPWTLVEEVTQRARSKKTGWVFNTFLKEEDG